jgi:hypothetical protein
VRDAIAAEAEVRQRLQLELESAIAGLQADMRLADAQIAAHEAQLAEVTRRLDRLASLRAKYSNLQQEVRQRGAIVEKAEHDLATARASQAAAASASLLTRLDGPLADDRPLGPGRALLVLAGVAGGLFTGLGLVFLTAPSGRQWGRRWTDFLTHGRRATDRTVRRAEDQRSPSSTNAVNSNRRAEDRNQSRRASDAPRNRRADEPPPIEAMAPSASTELALPVERHEASGPLSLTETLQRLVVEARKQS